MPSSIISPFPVFNDLDGTPLENGYIYIGQSNLNPETSPVNVFWDAALTIPAAQPIRTIGGFPSRFGTVSNFYVSEDTYSITVRNSRRELVVNTNSAGLQVPSGFPVPGSEVSFIQAGTGAVVRTMQNKVRENLSCSDFGDVDGVGEIVLNVPSTYSTIQDAFAFLETKRIQPGTTVRIQVADGTYTLSSGINASHPDGSQIKIIGNTTTPANCTLSFSISDGIYVGPGFCLAEINGFTIVKTGAKTNFGIFTFGGEISKIGPRVVVDNFYYGVSALNGGRVYADGTNYSNRVLVKNAGDAAFWAVSNSFVSCVYGEAQDSADPNSYLGLGFVAEFGSGMVANFAKATGCKFAGASALSSSAIRAWSSIFTNNLKHGIVTGSNGAVEVFPETVSGSPVPSDISNNAEYAHYTDGYGQCFGLNQATTTGNGAGIERNPLKIIDDGAIKFNAGSITVDANIAGNATGGDTYLDLSASTNKVNIIRSIINGTEQARLQYRSQFSVWELIAGSNVIFRAFNSGKVTIGNSAATTTSTSGIGIQIPVVSGPPTGVLTDVESGFVPIVYDAVNNRLYAYNGVWRQVTLS